MNDTKKKKTLVLSAAAAAVVVLGIGFWLGTHPGNEPLYGVMQAKTIDVAAKVTGRVESLNITEGDEVSAGQVLLMERLSNSRMAAASVWISALVVM